MSKKLILRLSNEMGNQMFMYASAYSIAKKLNRKLYIDDETAFLLKKNVSKFGLDFFNISAEFAPNKLKFKNLYGRIKRKFLIKADFFRLKKKFYIEKKDRKKITKYSDVFNKMIFDDNVFLEGHFESEKYFQNYKNEIIEEFHIKDQNKLKNNPYYDEINKTNSVSICLRQNRFTEGKGQNTTINMNKSSNFSKEQINYINKAAGLIQSKISKANFFLWSNDFSNIDNKMFNFKYKEIKLDQKNEIPDNRILSLFLLTQCNHFIVTASTFNWWGAWLSQKNNKIVFRPSDKFFKEFYLNNLDFWPQNWEIVDA